MEGKTCASDGGLIQLLNDECRAVVGSREISIDVGLVLLDIAGLGASNGFACS